MGTTEALIVSGLFVISCILTATFLYKWIWWAVEKDFDPLVALTPVFVGLWLLFALVLTL